MRALAGQKRPKPANAGPVKRRAVGVFTITVIVVAIPVGTGGQFPSEQRVDNGNRIENAWIVGGPQAKSHISERIRADQKTSFQHFVATGSISDWY